MIIKPIQLSSPDIGDEEKKAVNDVLNSPSLSMGPYIKKFEGNFSNYLGVKNAIAVSSGTAGLQVSVIAAGIKDGDEVITTPFSFVSSSNCLLYEHVKPVFVDIDPVTLTIDSEKIEAAITSKTKAILPVHVFGLPCNMDKIMAIAKKHDLVVIEDACEAIGAEWHGQKTGTFGNFGVFAFYPNKQMTTGEGGMVVVNNDTHAAILRSLINQGRDTDGTWLHHIRLGYNYRLDEMSSALGAVQISRINELLKKRDHVAEMYNKRLKKIPGVTIPCSSQGVRRSWFVYVIQLDEKYNRDSVMKKLDAEGIPTRPYFTPIHLQPFYIDRFGYKEGDFPVAEEVSHKTLALPFHNNLSEEQVEYVCNTIERILIS